MMTDNTTVIIIIISPLPPVDYSASTSENQWSPLTLTWQTSWFPNVSTFAAADETEREKKNIHF